MTISLQTDRLLLREWGAADCEPFCRDVRGLRGHGDAAEITRPRCMRRLDRGDTAHWAEHGYGLWAVEIPGEAQLIGGVGLHLVPFQAAFPPVVIAWRLARSYWGRGYAFEAARAVIDDSFGRLGFTEIVAYTIIVNQRSLALMERLGNVPRSP